MRSALVGCHHAADDVDGLGRGSRGAGPAGHDEDADPVIRPNTMMLRTSDAPVSWDVLLDVDVSAPTDMIV
ncbi:hypothetical protein P3H15_17595 [Rhodococcus sp. T2V]|uniref:hypothetical protein n=1 Tax=Rhodococcus sp. T2V TaxID=3034164 RepID=UPI0023E3265F|nr:hypothetical protein [Rhodococcus sp. T2V]MDF3306839.1 hypothetical protein [Rhodococcus sp. T2V]